MSVKRFCDVCGKKMDRNYVGNRYEPAMVGKDGKTGPRVELEIKVAIAGIWNNGEICLDCIKWVVNEGEENLL